MMKQIPTIAVLMSTYNGEKYLSEQLESVFSQKAVYIRLFVRDDGSSDKTLAIIDHYRSKYSIELLQDGESVGPGESFMRLVYRYANEPDIDYYAFADQDDIWHEDKLIVAVNMIKNYGKDEIVLYTSNQRLYIDGKEQNERYSTIQRVDLISHMTCNTISGCTFVFNRPLALLLANSGKPDSRILKYRLHDAWVILVAIVCGHVIYDDKSYMCYRIHSHNTVGINGISCWQRMARLQRFFVQRDDANIRMITAKELLRLFPHMHIKDKQVLKLYAEYQDNWKKKRKLAFDKNIKDNCLENPFVFFVKVMLNYI